jgi:hypothetical protein
MAEIYNETVNDPNSLNLDLDYVNNNFDAAMALLLDHLQDLIPDQTTRQELLDELKFYNLDSSPLYRISMDNPVINHVHHVGTAGGGVEDAKTKGGAGDFKQILSGNQQFRDMYKTVFDLMNLSF